MPSQKRQITIYILYRKTNKVNRNGKTAALTSKYGCNQQRGYASNDYGDIEGQYHEYPNLGVQQTRAGGDGKYFDHNVYHLRAT